MNEKNRIPLLVGVTGHIDLREEDRDTLYRLLDEGRMRKKMVDERW